MATVITGLVAMTGNLDVTAQAATPAVSRPAAAPAAPLAPTGSIKLIVNSARSVKPDAGFVHKGDVVPTYKWLINKDDTGDPGTAANPGYNACLPPTAKDDLGNPVVNTDPNYADTCPWPSVRPTSGWAAIVAQGTEADLNASTALNNLPNGKYLISVTAPNYKIDGQHFTVAGNSTTVTVGMQPYPLPLQTIRIQVFNDNAPVDATWEMDAEPGLPGFTGHLTDVFGLVSTDYYGNPLCTKYLRLADDGVTYTTQEAKPGNPVAFADGKPVIDPTSIGKCVSGSDGVIVIPNLGPNRYGGTVTPPAGQGWVQTTTLEGGHDHDIWQQEGESGYDTEATKGAEQVPYVHFGFAKTMPLAVPAAPAAAPTGEISGVAVVALTYIGGQNGQIVPQTGLAGAKYGGRISRPWVALSDLGAGDQQIYVGRGAKDGTFDIKNVPDGTYQLTLWDDAQDYILWSFNVTVENGEAVDVGNKALMGWFTRIHGTVFVDTNGNGKRDKGEAPVPAFTLTLRERDNSAMDQATNTVSTNDSGVYDIKEAYPMGKWLILEAFNTRYQTTGVTYKADNSPKATTLLGGAVDINVLNIIGLGGTVDWGVQPYNRATNGGIVGTISYDTTRNELDPRYAVSESYQPGIPDVPVSLHLPVKCTTTTPASSCSKGYQVDAAGALVKGLQVADTYTSETWQAPRGCTARAWNGKPLTDQQALPPFAPADNLCVESPMMGFTAGASDATPGNFSQTVNGNYGFSTSTINQYALGDPNSPTPTLALYAPLHCGADVTPRPTACPAIDPNDPLTTYDYDDQPLLPGAYLVSVDIPNDPVDGKPMYQVTKEEDVNIFEGDGYLPQTNFPPTLPLVNDIPGPATPAPLPTKPVSTQAGITPPCAGALHTVDVTNAAFLAGGGSPFQGQDRPLCDTKLVTVRSGQATAPNFNLYTPVPMPTHFWGLTLNDLGLSLDKRSVNYAEAQGLPFVPVGLYDWSGRLVDTTNTDFNGMYEALEPSTSTYNCPLPAGPCPNMYRFVGNDPGQPGQLNANYNPRFRTIATNFQAWPGLYTVTDEAPTQVAATAWAPGSTAVNSTMCNLDPAAPQILAVDHPYLRNNVANTIGITGFGFGALKGTGTAVLTAADGTTTASVTTAWTSTSIALSVPALFPAGPATLAVTASNGQSTVNSLTVQVLTPGSLTTSGTTPTNPRVVEVGPGKQFLTIQAALEFARPGSGTRRFWLVVVWPNAPTADTPHGEYNENIVVHHQVRIQGVGPGGFDSAGTFVPGSIIDGAGFNPDNAPGLAWVALVGGLRHSAPVTVPDAATVTFLDDPAAGNTVPTDYYPSLDGFTITGGSQTDFATVLTDVVGGTKTPAGAPGTLVTQGGGIYVHSRVNNLHITNNIIVGNSGSYGGALRMGTPYTGNNHNYGLQLVHNQIRDNGGTNLAGGIGLFAGSDGYNVSNNAICGNFSAEYGGAISAFGYQVHAGDGVPGGQITHNKIWFNQSYDEGGAVFVAGELPSSPNSLSEGSGPVLIDANVIQANLANDDGGGIRLLQVSGSHVSRLNPGTITITNNMIANNVSTHEGGGIAMDDAAFVDVVNNTIVRNMTTASAVTSNGQPAPAGLSTATNSALLQARLATPALFGSGTAFPTFSKPTLLNDIFWDNRAGTFVGGYVEGIGGTLPDGVTANTTDHWDLGVADDTTALLSPRKSVLQTFQAVDQHTVVDAQSLLTTTNILSNDPLFTAPFEIGVSVVAGRMNAAFRQAIIVTAILPPNLMGDYHLKAASPAIGVGGASQPVTWGTWIYTVIAPPADIDGSPRPTVTGSQIRYDAGADQTP